LTTALKATPQQDFQKGQHRWVKCIAAQGGYFEIDPSQWAVSIQVRLEENHSGHFIATSRNLIEFGITTELFRLTSTCLNKTFSKFRVDKHFSDAFPTQNCLKKGDAFSPLLFKLTL